MHIVTDSTHRNRWKLAAGAVGGVALLVALAVWDRARGAMPPAAVPVGILSAPRWWSEWATCAGDASRFPERVRWYAGRSVPASWSDGSPDAGRPGIGGWADVSSGRVVLLPSLVADSALVIHETWHIVHGRGHPAAVFGDGRTVAPRCGIAPP